MIHNLWIYTNVSHVLVLFNKKAMSMSMACLWEICYCIYIMPYVPKYNLFVFIKFKFNFSVVPNLENLVYHKVKTLSRSSRLSVNKEHQKTRKKKSILRYCYKKKLHVFLCFSLNLYVLNVIYTYFIRCIFGS